MLEGTHQQMTVEECQDSCQAHDSLVLDTDETLTFEQIQEEIRVLAHEKWEKAGRPICDGKGFWLSVERELFGRNPLEDGGYKLHVRNKSQGWELVKIFSPPMDK